MLFDKLFQKREKTEKRSYVDQFIKDSEKKYFDLEKFERLCKLIMCDDPKNLIPKCLETYSTGDKLDCKYDTLLNEYFTCGVLNWEEGVENGMNIASCDGGAFLEDFFWALDRIKQARHVDFTVEEAKFDVNGNIEDWLYELARELPHQKYKLCYFSNDDDNYRFSVFTDKEADEVIPLINALFPGIALAEIVNDKTVFV